MKSVSSPRLNAPHENPHCGHREWTALPAPTPIFPFSFLLKLQFWMSSADGDEFRPGVHFPSPGDSGQSGPTGSRSHPHSAPLPNGCLPACLTSAGSFPPPAGSLPCRQLLQHHHPLEPSPSSNSTSISSEHHPAWHSFLFNYFTSVTCLSQTMTA